ncbi:alpha/beta hydrolase [Undibacterium sp.]|uniref:alpha/beta hydrolase n=1 Tax=Undibacterium sp. TaxID=1914977 RepID=UPI002730EFF1|nr:alpha/beta hydrolase [Undibacterium sp.]MDP1979556.1 alpha/beta hydrolase [Undibacterium sp.]
MKMFSQANNLCRFTSFLYRLINCFILSLFAAASTHAAMPDAGHDIQPGIIYHRTGDEVLTGDLYRPKKNGNHPVRIAVHGGDWRFADASLYKHWGPYLAMNGYAVLAVNYRLVKDKTNLYRPAVHDVRAAVQFLRQQAATYQPDPDRIGLMGDSAGAQLATLVALAGDQPPFSDGMNPTTKVKVCIGIYGSYDLAVKWEHSNRCYPDNNIAQGFPGSSLIDNRKIYFEASPLSYVTRDNNRTQFLFSWGAKDKFVDPEEQSMTFMHALKQAGFSVSSVVLKNAGHYWASEPIKVPGTDSGYLAPRLLQFLKEKL